MQPVTFSNCSNELSSMEKIACLKSDDGENILIALEDDDFGGVAVNPKTFGLTDLSHVAT